MWQIRNVSSPLPQDSKILNLAGWSFRVRGSYLPGHFLLRDKLEKFYFYLWQTDLEDSDEDWLHDHVQNEKIR